MTIRVAARRFRCRNRICSRQAFARSRTDYAEFYGRMKDVPLAVSRGTGNLLYMLARSSRASSIIEFGTSFGLSTICLASALRDNGGGRKAVTAVQNG